MAVAGPYDTVGRARGFHSIREDESLSPRRLVTVLNWIAFSASSTLPQPHDVGDLMGICPLQEWAAGRKAACGANA